MNPEPVNKIESPKSESITAKELAFLAAILSPQECRDGAAGSALRLALALFEESNQLLGDFAEADTLEKQFKFADSSPGGNRLLQVWIDQIDRREKQCLRLDVTDGNTSDEVRTYLAEHGNFEGLKGRKAWSKVRTVWENFEKLFIWNANSENKRNAERIRAAEAKTAELIAANEGLANGPGRMLYGNEKWADWNDKFRYFRRGTERYGRDAQGRQTITHHEIHPSDLNKLIVWKRNIRRNGGVKAVKPWTRKEVLGAVKQKNPKKKK